MNEQERHALFSELVARHRSELYGYIFAVVRSWEDADDLFQAVCLVLWSKFESFQPGTSFFAWARQTARNKISHFLRHKQEPDFVDDELLEVLTTVAIGAKEDWAESYLTALRRCRAKLATADEELLELHYGEGCGTRQIADRLQRLQSNVCHSLARIRRWLFACIQMEIARQEHSGTEQS
jgi:RNA polymerase sigma-70 factor (ECF subfamily)